MALATCFATVLERRRPLPVDALIPDPIFTSTHAITIDKSPNLVWPWIAQMGSGRAGWYSWDAIDNGGRPNSTSIVPAFQTVVPGDIMPAVPGANDGFVVAAVDPPRDLVSTVPDGRGGNAVAWEHQRRSTAPSPRRQARDEAWLKALLICGIVSSLLYGAMIGAIRFEGYSRISQVPSELTAIGAPTRPLWMLLGAVYTVLVAAFGWGVWKTAGRSRALRLVGGLMLAYGSLGLLWPFASMHQRDVLAAGGGTLSDTMHVALGGVTVLLMFLAITVGATTFGKRFRLYSVASIVVLVAFGALTFWDAPRLQANLPTPWVGLWERINISVFLLWVVVLATVLLRGGSGRSRQPGAMRWTT
jgi:hypothetical protein